MLCNVGFDVVMFLIAIVILVEPPSGKVVGVFDNLAQTEPHKFAGFRAGFKVRAMS
jgi:hypothetical protein